MGRHSVLSRILRYFPLAFLFSRFSGSKVLEHKVREQIYLHITERPGAHYTGIKRELDLPHGTLSHHLRTLERERLIRSQREGLRLRFFPAAMGVTKSRTLNPWQLRILQEVQREPGVTQSEVARRISMSRQSLHYHIDQLRDAGLLGATPHGRETRLAVGPEAWARVGACPQCATPFLIDAGASTVERCSACGRQLRGAAA